MTRDEIRTFVRRAFRRMPEEDIDEIVQETIFSLWLRDPSGAVSDGLARCVAWRTARGRNRNVQVRARWLAQQDGRGNLPPEQLALVIHRRDLPRALERCATGGVRLALLDLFACDESVSAVARRHLIAASTLSRAKERVATLILPD